MAIDPGSNVVNGARAKLLIDEKVVGIFNSVSVSFAYDAQPVYVLGRAEPVEINYVSQEPVRVNAGGWRVIGYGPHNSVKLPKLQELLNQKNITLALTDRQTGKVFAKVLYAKPTGFSTSVGARQQQEISVEFTGIYYLDESEETQPNPNNADSEASFP